MALALIPPVLLFLLASPRSAAAQVSTSRSPSSSPSPSERNITTTLWWPVFTPTSPPHITASIVAVDASASLTTMLIQCPAPSQSSPTSSFSSSITLEPCLMDHHTVTINPTKLQELTAFDASYRPLSGTQGPITENTFCRVTPSARAVTCTYSTGGPSALQQYCWWLWSGQLQNWAVKALGNGCPATGTSGVDRVTGTLPKVLGSEIVTYRGDKWAWQGITVTGGLELLGRTAKGTVVGASVASGEGRSTRESRTRSRSRPNRTTRTVAATATATTSVPNRTSLISLTQATNAPSTASTTSSSTAAAAVVRTNAGAAFAGVAGIAAAILVL